MKLMKTIIRISPKVGQIWNIKTISLFLSNKHTNLQISHWLKRFKLQSKCDIKTYTKFIRIACPLMQQNKLKTLLPLSIWYFVGKLRTTLSRAGILFYLSRFRFHRLLTKLDLTFWTKHLFLTDLEYLTVVANKARHIHIAYLVIIIIIISTVVALWYWCLSF